jgi:hypothetical protein
MVHVPGPRHDDISRGEVWKPAKTAKSPKTDDFSDLEGLIVVKGSGWSNAHGRSHRWGFSVDTSLKIHSLVLALAIPVGVPSCAQPSSARSDPQVTILKKWALSRCLSHVAGQTTAGDDAARTAAAYLEMGSARIEVYEKLDALAKTFLAQTYTGSMESKYDTMKCIDFFESEELDRMAKDGTRP